MDEIVKHLGLLCVVIFHLTGLIFSETNHRPTNRNKYVFEGVEGGSAVLPCQTKDVAVWTKSDSGITILGVFGADSGERVPDSPWRDVAHIEGRANLRISPLDPHRDQGQYSCLTSQGEYIYTLVVHRKPQTTQPPVLSNGTSWFVIGLILGALISIVLIVSAILCCWRRWRRKLKLRSKASKTSAVYESSVPLHLQNNTGGVYDCLSVQNNGYLTPISTSEYLSTKNMGEYITACRVDSTVMYVEIADE